MGVITVDGIEIVSSSEKAICQALCYEVKLEKINKMIVFILPAIVFCQVLTDYFLIGLNLSNPSSTPHTEGKWKVKMKVKVTQSCLTLCDPMDYIVHGILEARILEWVAFPFSRESSLPRI